VVIRGIVEVAPREREQLAALSPLLSPELNRLD
jgi:hypothetical protein